MLSGRLAPGSCADNATSALCGHLGRRRHSSARTGMNYCGVQNCIQLVGRTHNDSWQVVLRNNGILQEQSASANPARIQSPYTRSLDPDSEVPGVGGGYLSLNMLPDSPGLPSSVAVSSYPEPSAGGMSP